jgi:hypothetical protein
MGFLELSSSRRLLTILNSKGISGALLYEVLDTRRGFQEYLHVRELQHQIVSIRLEELRKNV